MASRAIWMVASCPSTSTISSGTRKIGEVPLRWLDRDRTTRHTCRVPISTNRSLYPVPIAAPYQVLEGQRYILPMRPCLVLTVKTNMSRLHHRISTVITETEEAVVVLPTSTRLHPCHRHHCHRRLDPPVDRQMISTARGIWVCRGRRWTLALIAVEQVLLRMRINQLPIRRRTLTERLAPRQLRSNITSFYIRILQRWAPRT